MSCTTQWTSGGHDIWQTSRYQQYAYGWTDWGRNFEAKAQGILAALQANQKKPVISFHLSSLYMRQSDPHEAFPGPKSYTIMSEQQKAAAQDC